MKQTLYDSSDVINKINNGEKLILAGDEQLLKSLPAGNWIGGTIPYFMTEQGGLSTKSRISVTTLPDYIEDIDIKLYYSNTIQSINTDAYDHGFSVIIIPASSKTHLTFALKAPEFEGFATKPLIGWISGVQLDELNKIAPKIFNGLDRSVVNDGAIVLHARLPEKKLAEINIINIFKQGNGDTITFPNDNFFITNAFINGTERNFTEYLLEINADTRLPLVANYAGAMINISFQNLDTEKKVVQLYAPVFQGVEYKLASPVGDYITEFTSQMPRNEVDKIHFSCNCILNYLYSELEGKETAGVTGPITFGEIAYQLLNQTMAYLTIDEN